jgi:hypothetical protein
MLMDSGTWTLVEIHQLVAAQSHMQMHQALQGNCLGVRFADQYPFSGS